MQRLPRPASFCYPRTAMSAFDRQEDGKGLQRNLSSPVHWEFPSEWLGQGTLVQGTLTAKRSHQTDMHKACRAPGTINETGPAPGHVSRRCH